MVRAQGEGSPQRVEQLWLDDALAAPGGLRAVQLQFRALSSRGAPVADLAASELQVWEDAQPVDPRRLSLERLERAQHPVTLALALDVSGTMRGAPFAAVQRAALDFLGALQPGDRVAVLAFAQDAEPVAGFELARAQTRERLAALAIDPARSQRALLFDAVFAALERIRSAPDVPRTAFVIAVSDGRDGGSRQSLERVLSRARASDGRPAIPIFGIGLARFGREGLADLRALAQGSGGALLAAQSTEQLPALFERVALELGAGYRLRYPTSLDGAEHEIRLAIGERSAALRLPYPALSNPLWPWLTGGAGLLAALLAAGSWLALRLRRTGRLAIVSGPKSGVVFELRPGRNRIGAVESNDIVLLSSRVSRYHAEIVARGRRAQLFDLRSTNGTRLNGQVIQQSPLRAGDRIAIADVELVYEP